MAMMSFSETISASRVTQILTQPPRQIEFQRVMNCCCAPGIREGKIHPWKCLAAAHPKSSNGVKSSVSPVVVTHMLASHQVRP